MAQRHVREVYVNQPVTGKRKIGSQDNRVSTARYTLLSFLPSIALQQ
ncbi:hypothetical protein KIPB_008599, partial [Kipferlia bialata]|eukprot:g8599.t1